MTGITLDKDQIDKDFFLAVANGDIPGFSCIDKFGYNEKVGKNAEDIWSEGGDYTFATAAQTVDVVSDDNEDENITGDGAWTVELIGLDSSYDEIDEIINLNGKTAVTSSNSYLRLHRMIVRTAGSSGYNEGKIEAEQTTSGILMAVIEEEENQTTMAIYTIPNDKTGYMMGYTVGSDTDQVIALVQVRPEGEVFQTKRKDLLQAGSFQVSFPCPLELTEKTDIRIRAENPDKGDAEVSASFSVVLEDD